MSSGRRQGGTRGDSHSTGGSTELPPVGRSPRLDCDTRETTRASVASLLGADEAELACFLAELDLDDYYATHPRAGLGSTVVMNLLEKKFGRVRTANASVLWFHLTRVLPQSDFADGIMPLNLMLPGIWDMLAKMFAGTVHEMRLLQLRKQGVPGFLYDLKTGDSVHWGPFAMLIREASFRSSEMGNHDYLAMPEIVQDICRGYAEAFGVDLETEVSLRLRPCIVKFEAGPLERHHVEAAAYYLHIVEHGSEMSMWSNTCFSGEGRTIPPTHIERIDFI